MEIPSLQNRLYDSKKGTFPSFLKLFSFSPITVLLLYLSRASRGFTRHVFRQKGNNSLIAFSLTGRVDRCFFFSVESKFFMNFMVTSEITERVHVCNTENENFRY